MSRPDTAKMSEATLANLMHQATVVVCLVQKDGQKQKRPFVRLLETQTLARYFVPGAAHHTTLGAQSVRNRPRQDKQVYNNRRFRGQKDPSLESDS